jgi:hypothetical protein
LFNLIKPDLRIQWTEWIRECLRAKEYFNIHQHYRSLPIWKNLKGSFVPADDDVVMLPRGVPITHVSPFVPSSTVVFDGLLESMGISPSSILSILNIPKRLEDDTAYRKLLFVLLHSVRDKSSIPVPNS